MVKLIFNAHRFWNGWFWKSKEIKLCVNYPLQIKMKIELFSGCMQLLRFLGLPLVSYMGSLGDS